MYGWDCGDEVAEWLREKLYTLTESSVTDKPTVRLMYVGNAENLKRPAYKPDVFSFTQYKKEDMVRF